MTFIPSLTIPSLGMGPGYAIWSFRAAAMGHIDCPALTSAFERLFGLEWQDALGAVLVFAKSVGLASSRRISLAAPGCCGVTRDELAMVQALAAAQIGDDKRRDAHLDVLTCAGRGASVGAAADMLANCFLQAGLSLEPPQLYSKPEAEAKGPALRLVHPAGHA